MFNTPAKILVVYLMYSNKLSIYLWTPIYDYSMIHISRQMDY